MNRLRQRGLLTACVFGVTLSVFSVSSVHQLADSEYSMLLSQSLVEHGSFTLENYAIPRHEPRWHEGHYFANGAVYQLEVRGEHLYYYFPPGSSVLSVPFVALLNTFGVSAAKDDGSYDRGGEETIEAVLAALLMATLAVVFFYTAQLVLPLVLSAGVALAGALGTQVYSSASRAMWSDTWGVLLIGVAVLLLLAHETGKRRLQPVLLATLLAWSYFVRPTFAVHILAIAVYLLVFHRRLFPRFALTGLAWFLGFIGYSLFHFDQLLPSYYRVSRLDFDDFGVALAGNLFSPSRGLLVFVPVLLFLGYVLGRYRRYLAHRPLIWLSLAIVVGQLVIVSGYFHWWGGHSFGPRMTTGLVPWFVLLGVLGLSAMVTARRAHAISSVHWRRQLALGAALLALSIFINALGATSEASWRWNSRPRDVDQHPERLWDWGQPQFLAVFLADPTAGPCSRPLDRFVDDFYREVLRRRPPADELAHLTTQLTQAQMEGRDRLLAAAKSLGSRLFGSAEYRSLETSNERFVRDLYAGYLDRAPDKSGSEGWIRALINGVSRSDLRDEFADSEEFRRVVAQLCRADRRPA